MATHSAASRATATACEAAADVGAGRAELTGGMEMENDMSTTAAYTAQRAIPGAGTSCGTGSRTVAGGTGTAGGRVTDQVMVTAYLS